MCLACVFMATAQDRLDVNTNDGKIKSVMVDQIEQIRYTRSNNISADNGYDQVEITLKNGEKVIWNLNEDNEILYRTPTKEWLEIARTNDAHSWVVMYDCINNEGIMDPDKPLDWTAERCGRMPHFNYFAEKGFDPYYTLTGQYTGTVYSDIDGFVWWSLPEDNMLGLSAWTFIMPNEPVIIAATSVERTTYKDAPFLGEYKGFPIKIGDKMIYAASEPVFSVLMKANETYTLKSTDENNFSFIDWYTYNADKNSFSYQEKEFDGLKLQDSTVYAAGGQFFNDDVLVDIYNLTEDKPDNMKYYFGSKDIKQYVCAAKDKYGFEFLIEATGNDNNRRWYFVTNYGMKKMEATVDFYYGKSINDICEGYVSYDGEVQMKYTKGYGSAPVFVNKGSEAGTYKCIEAGGSDLILDGFGSAEYNGKTCGYTVEGSVATLNISGEMHLFELNDTDMTYYEIVSDEWEGPKFFVNENTYGGYSDNEANSLNKAYIFIDKDYNGAEKPGYMTIAFDIEKDGAYNNVYSETQKYLWQADKKTITVVNLLVGVKEGGFERRNLVFRVSDDMRSMYLTGFDEYTRIYSTSYTGSFIDLNESNAVVAPDDVKLADEYQGKFSVLNFGMESGEADCTLKLNKDVDGNAKDGYAAISAPFMGAYLMNATAKYSVSGSSLTLHDITVGDGNYGTKNVDIVFTITPEGNLTGSEAYYGPDMMTAFMQIDFSKGMFTPMASNVEIPDENFKKYLVENFDKNLDGEISFEEAENITMIKCSTVTIYSVKGIEAMPNLVELYLAGGTIGGNIESIDLSGNKKLQGLTLTHNKISSVDLSNNPDLEGVYLGDNPLNSIDVSANAKIQTLKFYRTNVESVNLTNNVNLEKLECQECKITGLDITNNLSLRVLDCSFNKIQDSLDISKNTSLSQLYATGNPDLKTIWVWEGFNESDYEYFFYKDDTAAYKVK